MKFREGLGTAWMAAMFAWQIENVPLLEILIQIKSFKEAFAVVLGTAYCALWTFGVGFLIGWSK